MQPIWTRLTLMSRSANKARISGVSAQAMQDGLRTRLVTVFVLLSIAPLVLGSLISLVVSVSITQREITEGQEYAALTIGQGLDNAWKRTLANLANTTTILGQD